MKIKQCKTSKTLFSICFFGFLLTLGMQMFVSNRFAVKGAELSTLLERQKELEKEIYAQELKLSQLSSLSYIEKMATKSGFVSSSQVVYLDSPTFAANIR
jgi:hypothetical protein